MTEFKEFSVAVANKEQFEAVRDVLEGMGYVALVSRDFASCRLFLSTTEDGHYCRSDQQYRQTIPFNKFMRKYRKKEAPVALYSCLEGEGSVYNIYSPEGVGFASTDNEFSAMYIVNELNMLLTKE